MSKHLPKLISFYTLKWVNFIKKQQLWDIDKTIIKTNKCNNSKWLNIITH